MRLFKGNTYSRTLHFQSLLCQSERFNSPLKRICPEFLACSFKWVTGLFNMLFYVFYVDRFRGGFLLSSIGGFTISK